MAAAVTALQLSPGSVEPGWALQAGGNHGIDSLMVAPLQSHQTMLYFFVQSKTSIRGSTVSLSHIFRELRRNMRTNGIKLPALNHQVPGTSYTKALLKQYQVPICYTTLQDPIEICLKTIWRNMHASGMSWQVVKPSIGRCQEQHIALFPVKSRPPLMSRYDMLQGVQAQMTPSDSLATSDGHAHTIRQASGAQTAEHCYVA